MKNLPSETEKAWSLLLLSWSDITFSFWGQKMFHVLHKVLTDIIDKMKTLRQITRNFIPRSIKAQFTCTRITCSLTSVSLSLLSSSSSCCLLLFCVFSPTLPSSLQSNPLESCEDDDVHVIKKFENKYKYITYSYVLSSIWYQVTSESFITTDKQSVVSSCTAHEIFQWWKPSLRTSVGNTSEHYNILKWCRVNLRAYSIKNSSVKYNTLPVILVLHLVCAYFCHVPWILK